MSKTEYEVEIIGMLEQLREDLRPLGNAKSELYFGIDALLRELANLYEVNLATAFRTSGPCR